MSSLVLLMEEELQAAQILDLRPRHRRVKIITMCDKFSENQLKRNMQTVIAIFTTSTRNWTI